jgi:hypothetical protein
MSSVDLTIRKVILISVLVLLVSLTSCSNSTQSEIAGAAASVTPIGSCDATIMLGYCYDYVGPGWNQEKIELDCGDIEDGLLELEPCPRDSVVASCNFDLQGNADLAITYYYYEPMDLDAAEMMCPGTLIPSN